MSDYNRNLSGIKSPEVEFDFYDDSFEVSISNPLSIHTVKLDVFESHIEKLCSFEIIPFETTRGQVTSLDGAILYLTEVEVVNSEEGVDFDGLYGPAGIFNFKETVTYTTYDEYKMQFIAIPDEIKFLGLKYLSDTSIQVADVIIGDSSYLNDSVFPKILFKANKAKVVGFRQNFWLYNTDSNYYAKIKDTAIPLHAYIEIWKVSDSKLINSITFLPKIVQAYPHTDEYPVTTFEIAPDTGDSVIGTIDLEGITSIPIRIVEAVDENIYSPLMPLIVDGTTLDSAVYEFTRNREFDSFDSYRSNLLSMIKLTASIYDYKIRDFDAFYSHPWSPVLNVYHPEDYINLNEYLSPMAEWNDHRDLDMHLFDVGNFEITEAYYTELIGNTYDYATMEYEVEEPNYIDTNEYVSNWMNFEIGTLLPTKKEGLYRDVFVSDYEDVVSGKTPWLSGYGSIRRLKDWNFFDIGFDVAEQNIFFLDDSSYDTVLLDWEQVFVEDNKWTIPEYNLAPYIRLEDESTFDFMLIAISSTGGSITHMHKDGYMDDYTPTNTFNVSDNDLIAASAQSGPQAILDSSLAEVSAKTLSSTKYKRHAKVLHELNLGLNYDQYVIDDAVAYLSRESEKTLFFESAPYNALVLNSIINDKTKGLVGKNVFDRSPIEYWNDVPYSYEIVDDIQDGVMTFSYIVSHRNSRVVESKSLLQTLFQNKTISGSSFLDIVDNCGNGTNCGNYLINGLSVIGAISDRIFVTSASMDTSYEAYDRYVIPFENNTIIDLKGVDLYPYVEMQLLKNYEEILTDESNLKVTIGTAFEPLYYDGTFTLGTIDLEGMTSEESNLSVSFPDTILEDTYADFWIKVHFNLKTDNMNSVYSDQSVIEMNVGFVDLKDHYDRIESIWLKMFFPTEAGSSGISAKFMDFNISSVEFDKNFSFPYVYVDDPYVVGDSGAGKSGNGDIKEVKYKEFNEDTSKRFNKPELIDIICGEERTTTYLNYQGHDHIFTMESDTLFGNYPIETKETLMSGYIRIVHSAVLSPGKSLADLDIMSRSLSQIQLSFIDDLDVVADWNIEEFTLEASDFGLLASQAEQLSSIDEIFRNTLKAVIDTIGDEIIYIDTNSGENRFTTFPERPAPSDELATSIKVKQYFAVEEIVVQN